MTAPLLGTLPGVLLWGPLGVLALLVALAVVLACLPWRLHASAQSEPQFRLRVEAGVLGLRRALYDSARPAAAPPPRRKTPEPAPRSPRKPPPWPLIEALPGLAFDALRRLRVELCRVELRLGLADPAQTGELYGRLAPLTAFRWALPPQSLLRVEPVFDRETLEGAGEIRLSLVPVRLLPLLPRLWRAWRGRARA